MHPIFSSRRNKRSLVICMYTVGVSYNYHSFPPSRYSDITSSPNTKIHGPPKITLSAIPLSFTNAAISFDSAPGWNHIALGSDRVEGGGGKSDCRMGRPRAGLMITDIDVEESSGRKS